MRPRAAPKKSSQRPAESEGGQMSHFTKNGGHISHYSHPLSMAFVPSRSTLFLQFCHHFLRSIDSSLLSSHRFCKSVHQLEKPRFFSFDSVNTCKKYGFLDACMLLVFLIRCQIRRVWLIPDIRLRIEPQFAKIYCRRSICRLAGESRRYLCPCL